MYNVDCTFVVHVMLHQIIDDATVLTPGPDDDPLGIAISVNLWTPSVA
jgi:hypothetical protein